MRRLTATAVFVAALLFAGGCADGSEPSAAGTNGASVTSAAGDTAVCDEIKTINTQYRDSITTKFNEGVELAFAGDEAGATKVGGELDALAGEWASKLGPVVARTGDPDLKKPLQDLLAGVQKLGPNMTMNTVKTLVADADAAMQEHCG